MSTRHELLRELRQKRELVQTNEYCYNKIIKSGELAKTHFDYNVGFYDVSICYFTRADGYHYVRVYFGNIDDGCFGSWNQFEDKEKSLKLLKKLKDRFETLEECPNVDKLNVMFRDLGVYFCIE